MISSTGIKRTPLAETGAFDRKEERGQEPLTSQFYCHFVCLLAFVVSFCDCRTQSWEQDAPIILIR